MKPQHAVAMCLPHRRDDLPAYARTGQLHSGHPEAEVQSRCIDLLYAVHGADHEEHEAFNQYLENTGHPIATGRLKPQQAQRVAAMARRYQERQDQDTSDCAELLLNAAGIMLEQAVITSRHSSVSITRISQIR